MPPKDLTNLRTRHAFHLWGYVVMPEYVHLLIYPTTVEYSISAIPSTTKQSVAKQALAFVRAQAPSFLEQMEDRRPDGHVMYRFWQRGGGYDRNLTEPTTHRVRVDVIQHGPDRRGLCSTIFDWEWSSAMEWEHPGTGQLRIDRESMPRTTAG